MFDTSSFIYIFLIFAYEIILWDWSKKHYYAFPHIDSFEAEDIWRHSAEKEKCSPFLTVYKFKSKQTSLNPFPHSTNLQQTTLKT